MPPRSPSGPRDYADVSPLKEIYSDGDDRSGPVVEITRLA
jgi:hypothetical protein